MALRRTEGGAAGILAAAFLCACILGGCAHGSAATREEEERQAAFGAMQARRLALAASLLENDTGKTIISKVSYAESYSTSFLVVTRSGTRIAVDPFMVLEGIEADLILSTHKDMDHNDAAFYQRMPGATKSLYTIETVEAKDVRATGIPASHYGDDFDPAKPSDVIYLVEADGMRLAFLGDICQTRLTEAQLAALGRVDVAFIIMEDAPSYGYEAARSLFMLRQMDPRLAFPVHPSNSVIEKLGEELGGVVDTSYRFAIGAEELAPGPTRIVRLAPLPAN
jgi:hypothetical protein